MNQLKRFLLLISLLMYQVTFAGGLKAGAFDEFFRMIAIIFIGGPVLIGIITVLVSKEKKVSRFFIAFFSSLAILLLITLAFVQ